MLTIEISSGTQINRATGESRQATMVEAHRGPLVIQRVYTDQWPDAEELADELAEAAEELRGREFIKPPSKPLPAGEANGSQT